MTWSGHNHQLWFPDISSRSHWRLREIVEANKKWVEDLQKSLQKTWDRCRSVHSASCLTAVVLLVRKTVYYRFWMLIWVVTNLQGCSIETIDGIFWCEPYVEPIPRLQGSNPKWYVIRALLYCKINFIHVTHDRRPQLGKNWISSEPSCFRIWMNGHCNDHLINMF